MLTYKCPICKENVVLEYHNLDNAVRIDKRVWHKKCFEERCRRGMKTKNRRSIAKWTKLWNDRDSIYNESYKKNKRDFYEDQIYRFVLKNYPVSILPSSFFTRLKMIEKGEFKGMSRGIPLEDFYEMWKREMPFLRKVRERNKSKGKEFTEIQLIGYDMAIIRGDYDKYLKWKKREQSNKIIKNDMKQSDEVSTSLEKLNNINIANKDNKSNTDTNSIDINEALSSIFN